MVGDLRYDEFVKELFYRNNISHVIHCAANWNGRNDDIEVVQNNSFTTVNLVKNLTESVEKFIFISTSVVYNEASYDYYEDADLMFPNNSYGSSKLFDRLRSLYRGRLSALGGLSRFQSRLIFGTPQTPYILRT